MSIFGVKKYTTDENLTLRINDLTNRLQNINTDSLIVKQKALETSEKIENLKSTITITAENKSLLFRDEVFSFGNGGNAKGAGYVVMMDGHITGISLSSERLSGEVRVGVLVNGEILKGCEITLNTTPRKHDIFEHPFLVNAGSVINFVSLEDNKHGINTVASLLFEFKK